MDIIEKIHSGLAGLEDQKEALKNPRSAYFFARYVPGADIEKCQNAVCKNSLYAYLFARDIKESDIKMSLEACKGTPYEAELNQLLMEIVLL